MDAAVELEKVVALCHLQLQESQQQKRISPSISCRGRPFQFNIITDVFYLFSSQCGSENQVRRRRSHCHCYTIGVDLRGWIIRYSITKLFIHRRLSTTGFMLLTSIDLTLLTSVCWNLTVSGCLPEWTVKCHRLHPIIGLKRPNHHGFELNADLAYQFAGVSTSFRRTSSAPIISFIMSSAKNWGKLSFKCLIYCFLIW